MRSPKLLLCFLAALVCCFSIDGLPKILAADPAPLVNPVATVAKPKVMAIFVKNRAKSVDDAKVSVVEDDVTTKVTDNGFHVISREDAINSVKAFAKDGPNKGNDKLVGAEVDELLSNNTSALQLAHNLGADYLLMVSISTYAENAKTVDVDGVKAKITRYDLTCTFKVLSGTTGESLTGDTVKTSYTKQEQPGNVEVGDPIDDLLHQAATKLVDSIKAKTENGAIGAPAVAGAQPEFYIDCSTPDLEIPQVLVNDKGEYKVEANSCKLAVMAATVELDGVVVGTTPGPLNTTAGLHKIRISHVGFHDWGPFTIGISDGKHLTVAMKMDDAEMVRWKSNIAFLEQMRNNAKMTDAEVERVKGMAKMFSQSGFKVDMKSDVKVDAKGNDLKSIGNSLWPDPTTTGKDGRDGRDGRDGKDGKDGHDGKDAVPVPPTVPTVPAVNH